MKGSFPDRRKVKNRPTERRTRSCARNNKEIFAHVVRAPLRREKNRVDFITNEPLVLEPMFVCPHIFIY